MSSLLSSIVPNPAQTAPGAGPIDHRTPEEISHSMEITSSTRKSRAIGVLGLSLVAAVITFAMLHSIPVSLPVQIGMTAGVVGLIFLGALFYHHKVGCLDGVERHGSGFLLMSDRNLLHALRVERGVNIHVQGLDDRDENEQSGLLRRLYVPMKFILDLPPGNYYAAGATTRMAEEIDRSWLTNFNTREGQPRRMIVVDASGSHIPPEWSGPEHRILFGTADLGGLVSDGTLRSH